MQKRTPHPQTDLSGVPVSACSPDPSTYGSTAPTYPSLCLGAADGSALFLDLDGTLLDIAPAPDTVVRPPELCALLVALEGRLDGALALVTGRDLAFVDALFTEHRFTVAGLHGAEIRPNDLTAPSLMPLRAEAGAQPLLAALLHVETQAACHPGLRLERKVGAFALHYRSAPELRGIAEGIMAEALRVAGPAYILRGGKCVVELGRAGACKGEALRNIMISDRFRGRRPIAAGDDLTDEAMFAAANAMGGLSIRIGDVQASSHALRRVPTPLAFRSWLQDLARVWKEEETHDANDGKTRGRS